MGVVWRAITNKSILFKFLKLGFSSKMIDFGIFLNFYFYLTDINSKFYYF